MEPLALAEAQGQRENGSADPEIPATPEGQGTEDVGVGKETTAGDILAVNRREQEASEGLAREGAPLADSRESAPKGEEPPDAKCAESVKLKEADSKEREELPREDIPRRGSTSPPNSPASNPVGIPEETPKPRASPANQPQPPDFYCVKWISWKGERTPVITQSENGPCPLLAIMNILFLQWKVKLSPQKEVITSDELMAHLGDCILSIKPQQQSEALQLNFQQNVNDAMTVLPKLSTGLDVNVRFTGVSDFEYTPECIVFDLLNVPLYHGWLVDPQTPEVAQAVSKLSYNQLVEKIITCKHSNDPNLVTEGNAFLPRLVNTLKIQRGC